MTLQYDPDLIDRIYEAAVLPDGWRTVIENISARFDTKGGLLFASTAGGLRWLAAGEAEAIMVDFIAQGWPAHNDRVPRLLARQYPGFVTDTDVYTAEEIAHHPMYREFLVPRGVYAAAATAIQGASSDMLIFSLEGFGSPDAARAAIPYLDGLRPHLARAAMLASQIQLERARAATTALQMVGMPAAFVSTSGQLRCVNHLLEPLLDLDIFDTASGIRFADGGADQRLRLALAALQRGSAQGFSMAIRISPERRPAILHAIPVTRLAREVFRDGGLILAITDPRKAALPGAELLQALFDLTPAEAKLARALAQGASPEDIARRFDIRVSTVRSQLKSLFAKLGVNRQAQLVSLLAGLTLPG